MPLGRNARFIDTCARGVSFVMKAPARSMASALERVSVSAASASALPLYLYLYPSPVSESAAWKRHRCVSLEATTACGRSLALDVFGYFGFDFYFGLLTTQFNWNLRNSGSHALLEQTTSLAQFTNLQLHLLAALHEPILLME